MQVTGGLEVPETVIRLFTEVSFEMSRNDVSAKDSMKEMPIKILQGWSVRRQHLYTVLRQELSLMSLMTYGFGHTLWG